MWIPASMHASYSGMIWLPDRLKMVRTPRRASAWMTSCEPSMDCRWVAEVLRIRRNGGDPGSQRRTMPDYRRCRDCGSLRRLGGRRPRSDARQSGRVERTDHAPAAPIEDMRVHHRGGDVAVAEQLLHRANVVTRFEEVRRE